MRVVKFGAVVKRMGSIRKPKRLSFHGNDEKEYYFLVKVRLPERRGRPPPSPRASTCPHSRTRLDVTLLTNACRALWMGTMEPLGRCAPDCKLVECSGVCATSRCPLMCHAGW